METLTQLFLIFFSAAIINNFVLHYFVGVCPFLGVSKRADAAFGMGAAVTFVMVVACSATWCLTYFVLAPGAPVPAYVWNLLAPDAAPPDLSILSYVAYIFVIAGSVQFVELYVRKMFPALHKSFGIFLPLITTNCAIMFACLMVAREMRSPVQAWGFTEALVLALGAGLGFTLAIVLMAGLREELELCDVPKAFRGAAIALLVAGILAMAFMGFAGVDRGLAEFFAAASHP